MPLLNVLVAAAPSPGWGQVATIALLGAALMRLAAAEWARGRTRAIWRLAAVPGLYFLGMGALGTAQRLNGATLPGWLWGLLLAAVGALWVVLTVLVLRTPTEP